MTMEAAMWDAADAGKSNAGAERFTDDRVDRMLKAIVAGSLIMLAGSVGTLAAVASLLLWFYGAWSAWIEVAVLAFCVLVVTLSITTVKMWLTDEL